jgi:hypothetical protein
MLTHLENIDLVFSQEQSENEPLNYFLNPRKNGPNQEQLKNWPISGGVAFVLKYRNIPSNPGAIVPKETEHEETHTDFYVSPRKFIRYTVNQGHNFIYSDKFFMESLFTVSQNPDFSV